MVSKSKKKTTLTKRIIIRLWKLFFLSLFLVILFLFTVRIGLWGKLPDFKELENPKTKIASEIFANDGSQIGKYFYQEDRTNSEFSEIPQHMFEALIATEDRRFNKHSGIDVRALLRAVSSLGKKGGGSTITQQLAKNLFHERAGSLPGRLLQKTKEWILAVELEKRYTKDEIILMYFNTVPWGNSFGIKSASKRYFNKPTSELNIEESTVLVGMLKAPTYYNPVRNPENATRRRNVVMSQMKKYDYISKAEYDSLKELSLITDYTFVDHNVGLATHFRSYLARWLKEWTKEYEKNTGIKYNIYDDGLKIYTTIDPTLQKYAENAVNNHMKSLQEQFYKEMNALKREPWYIENQQGVTDKEFIPKMIKRTERYRVLKKEYKSNLDSIDFYLNKPVPMQVFTHNGSVDTLLSPIDSLKHYKKLLRCGFMSMDPTNGHIKAWVGGLDHRFFQYDHVNKNANRQVGSTFKPFVYARALDDEKIMPCEVVSTGPVVVEYDNNKTWSPKNAGRVAEEVTFYKGLTQSINTVTARVMQRLGPNSPLIIKEVAGKMGIDESKFVPYPSISLGVMNLSVFEMVGAYGTFVNGGTYREPIFITKIEDKNGNILAEFIPDEQEAIREQTAYIVCKMLERVTQGGGTAARLRYRYNIPNDAAIAGKTGTTQNNSDGWFIGFSPNLVSGCWVGAEDRQVRFRSTAFGQGANMALPVVAQYLEKAYTYKKFKIDRGPFKKPDYEMTIELDCSAYNEDNEEIEDYDDDLF
jgi:penicillin-binding protein 1A